jgi:hypothetical protein
LLSVGGGTTAAGLVGQYFNNATLSGSPAFTRTDVRVDFDWGGTTGPGGSSSPGFSAVGPTGFSVRWTGQVVPAFSEAYTFTATTAGGVRFSIRPAGSSAWTQLINNWADHEAVTADSGTIALTAGQAYDIEMDYVAADSDPVARLGWSSPSTPYELVEPLSQAGYNFLPYAMPAPTFADAFRQARDEWLPVGSATSVPTDANGWPLSDARKVIWEGQDPATMAGTYLLQFQGKAAVYVQLTGSFSVGGTNYGRTLPSGAGYDPATDTTTAYYTTPGDSIMSLQFTRTQRDASAPLGGGISHISLMRPTAPGGSTPYAAGTLFTTTLEAALGRFTTIRYGTSINQNTEVNWSDRTLPSYDVARKGFASMAWEDIVMLSNELGKDMYLQIPMGATDDYVTRLAKLIKYGSDGVNPYDSPQAHPVYPPLNPDLKVYLEWSNEIWNWSYTQASQGVQLAAAAIKTGTPDGKAINYDGGGNYQRYYAARLVDTSKIFRAVWGDAAMGDRVRVLLEYQYNDGQGTASGELTFIDNYYNDGDGVQHVADPHPVSYYIWGAGGANYYTSGNPRGYQTAIVAQDAGFESPALVPASVAADSTGTPWSFTGDAGIVSNGAGPLGSVPNAPEGVQAAYIGSTGTLSQRINFSSTGAFALDFYAAAPDGKENAVDIYFDGQKITPRTYLGAETYTPGSDPWLAGRDFGRDYRKYALYGSVPFQVTTTGPHTILIVGRGDGYGHQTPGLYLFVDRMRITSLDALFNGGIPSPLIHGFSSYKAQLDAQASYAQAFGLHVVAYEGGWGVGSERDITPLDSYAKYVDPRTKQANLDSIQAFQQSGGSLYMFGSFPLWANLGRSGTYPLVQAIDASNQAMPAAVDFGTVVPASLHYTQTTWALNVNNHKFWTTGLATWNILVPHAGNFTVASSPSYRDGSRGTLMLVVDGSTQLAQGSSDGTYSGTVALSAGLHVIMVKNIQGSFYVPNISVQQAPPTPPSDAIAVVVSASQINLSWVDNSTDETGFKVFRATDAAFTQGLTLVTTTGPNVTTWQDQGLQAQTTYYYHVSATNAAGDSAFSNTASATTSRGRHHRRDSAISNTASATTADDTQAPGSVAGLVYEDRADNGRADSGDPGLGGREIDVYNASGNLVASQLTASDGRYAIIGLPPGNYTVEEVSQAGWVQTEAQEGYQVTVTSGQTSGGLDFGNFQEAAVSGTIYQDVTGNGTRDGSDPGLGGWTISALDSAGSVVATATTDAAGSYTIAGLGPGTFTLQETLPAGWVGTQADNSAFTTVSGGSSSGKLFGNFQTIQISGSVYRDGDGNGLRNSGEPGLAGWTVELRDFSGRVVSSVTTDSAGQFVVRGIGPGTWTVAEVAQDNWVKTQPSFPLTYSLTARSGSNAFGLNFGDHPSPSIHPSAVIDNQGAGYTETGSWTTVSGGYGGTTRRANTKSATPATATAGWSFTGLQASIVVDIYVSYRSRTGNTTAAPFTVYDGSAAVGTVSVNEAIPVTMDQGLAQGSYGGVGWVRLGSFGIASGTLNVSLVNVASGTYVNADGVLILKRNAITAQLPAVPAVKRSAVLLDASASGTGEVTPARQDSTLHPSSSSTTVAGGANPLASLPVVYGKRPPAGLRSGKSSLTSS